MITAVYPTFRKLLACERLERPFALTMRDLFGMVMSRPFTAGAVETAKINQFFERRGRCRDRVRLFGTSFSTLPGSALGDQADENGKDKNQMYNPPTPSNALFGQCSKRPFIQIQEKSI